MKHLSKNRALLLSSLLLILMSPMSAFSDVPQVVSYTGQLSDGSGVVDATVSLTFNLYEDANNDGSADGSSIWTETHATVVVTNGVFGVALGSVGGVLGNLEFDVPYLLGINVNGDGEMSTLLRLTSAPTALRAENTKGSSAIVDCTTVPGGGKIQAALDAGATTVVISGVCEEAVSITRSGVTLSSGTAGGIEGPLNDGDPALSIVGASQVVINGLALTEDTSGATTDEFCVLLMSGANATFSGVAVSSCPDIGVSILLNSSANFVGAASTISGGLVGMEVVGGSSANIEDLTISGFSEEGLFVGGNAAAFLNGPTITATGVDVEALLIEGSSSVEVDDAAISSSGGDGVSLRGGSSLAVFNEGGTTTISGDTVGIFVFNGSVELETGTVSISSVNGNGIEIHNNSTAIIFGNADIDGGTTTGFGVQCTSNATLNTFQTLASPPTIDGGTGGTNGSAGGSNFCTDPNI